jgi:hypothetical protein
MKMRNDSPFAKLTEEQCDSLVMLSEGLTLEQLVKVVKVVKVVKGGPEPIECSLAAMSRFLKKAKEDKMLRDAQASDESVEAFAKRGENPKVREATLAAMRDRMFELVVDSNNADRLMETFESLKAEKEKERLLGLEERKVKVAEENAKLGWRKLECENARSGLKLLPKVRELLSDGTRSCEERVRMALDCLGAEGAKLLVESTDK